MTRVRTHFITFLVLLGVIFVLIVLDQTQRVDGVQDIGQRLTLPAERFVSSVGNWFDDLFTGVGQRQALLAENEALRDQLNELALINVQLTELKRENEQLRAQLDYKEDNPNFTLLAAEIIAQETPAQVIGGEISNLARGIRINQGSESGVEVGMSVVAVRGLVGHVTEVGRGWSKVVLLLDAVSTVSAVTQQGNAIGVVQGTGSSLIMRHIPHEQRVEPGDIVMTAGLSGTIPPGLTIGTVESVERGDVNPSQEAVVRPTVDFSSLDHVFIIPAYRLPVADPLPTVTPTDEEPG